MDGVSLHHNVPAMNISRMLGLNEAARAKSTEKLSSGDKTNRAADDAAGLAISEKMRKKIRGLKQGTENAQDGISWVQTGDGALDETQEILKRMTELTIKSLNGTNSQSDRADMQAEFEQLKVELDRISTTTKFNEMNIFSEHKPYWYQCNGAVKWEPDQMHVVTAGENDLTFKYRQTEDDNSPMTLTITIPPGKYNTVELLDEIDTAISDSMGESTRFFLEYDKDGHINATLEGGGYVDYVSGGLSYLLYDMYKGGNTGALLGTTIFRSENAKLDIIAGKNDSMTFDIEYFDGRTDKVTMTLQQGKYTRKELIDLLNAQLAGTSVVASAYGTGIKLGSPDAFITGFKGNMFRIDGANYTSVFYDNVRYGEVKQHEAVFTGGYVLNTDTRDKEHEKIKIIAGQNDVLTLQPNREENPVSLTLDPGEYTMEGIRDKLNSLFQTNQLDLKASVIFRSLSVGDKNVQFKGLEIRSTIKGLDSRVNLDTASSAFNTLFVTRNYNKYGDKVQVDNETKADQDAWFRGSKDLTVPIRITSDNDTFKITFRETDVSSAYEMTIKLPNKEYTSLNDLVAEINAKIEADPNSKDKLKAKAYITGDGKYRLQIEGSEGKNIDSITASAELPSQGYDMLFQGYQTEIIQNTNSGAGSITLSGSVSSSSMTVIVGGRTYTVTFPNNPPSKDEIVAALTIPGSEYESPNKFNSVSGRGSNQDRNFPASGSGNTTVTPWSGSKTGDSKKIEGMVGFEYNKPAELELGPQLQDQMVINANNNTLSLTLNGVAKSITLPAGTYNQQTLRNELQHQIDEVFGTGMGGAEVILQGNKLTLKSRLPEDDDGRDTSIKCGTDDSSFLRYLNTTETKAVCTSDLALVPSITINSSNNQFTFQYTENGNTQNVALTLDNGTYSPSTIVAQLNTQLNKTGTGVQAFLDNGKLALTSAVAGNGISIAYDTRTAGSAMDALYGALTGSSPANIVVPLDIQDSITIDAGKESFTIVVNGSMQTVNLTPDTYTREGFRDMLNGKLNAIGVEAYLSGNRLGFRTIAKGPDETLSMDYTTGGDSMKAIYGATTVTVPGIHAEWVDDKLVLTAVDKGGNKLSYVNVSVSSATSGGLQPPTVIRTPLTVGNRSGYHSRKKSKVDGADLTSPIAIDEWNNELKFTFTEKDKTYDVAITVADKNNYTYQELQDELQGKIDTAVGGANKIAVTVDGNGVMFTSAAMGNQYQFSNLSGDFYQNVLCQCTRMSETQGTQDKDGWQDVEKAYVVGRKDVMSQPVEITQGVSDELSMDLTIDGVVHKIEVTLDPGRYSGDALRAHLQDKIDQACVDMGMEKGTVEVGIGGISTGVAGGNDQKALNFSLAEKVQLPGDGEYIIDGVSGNAAFEVFYQTDGRMIPTYIMGTKDVTKGITVRPGETELSVCVDGDVYNIQLEEGPHTGKELVDELNQKLNDANAPLGAHIDLDTGRLKIAHKLAGTHDISWVSGSAKDEIFFEEEGGYEDTVRRIQLSDENPDYIELMRSEYSASLIGVNSLCITGIKYATKAVDRLSSALEKISSLRSNFGSIQNRLEHAIDNNRNKMENLQSAESIIRDTDMAKEMVRQSTLQILVQAGYSMLAQANQNGQAIMELLG